MCPENIHSRMFARAHVGCQAYLSKCLVVLYLGCRAYLSEDPMDFQLGEKRVRGKENE